MTITIKANLDGLSGAIQANGNDVIEFNQSGITQGAPFSFRNKLINGNFDVWQRGAITPALGSVFAADRWFVYSAGASPTSIASGGSPDNNSNYSLLVSGKAANTSIVMVQRIEAVHTQSLFGKYATVSGWVYTTDTRPVTLYLSYANSTDNFTAVTNIGTAVQSSATGWRYVTATFVVPGVKSGLEVGVSFGPTLAGVSVAIARFQLEEGSIATPFENRPIGLELALCQRYYQSVRLRIIAYQSVAGGHNSCGYQLPVIMRSVPTSTLLSTFSNNNVATYVIAAVDSSMIYSQATSVVAGVIDSDRVYALSTEL